ncbi:MAG: hypothetical protein JWN48_1145 [Myxococcaceae bacterium]|nr:hypothetical protein [Myxococcaceae bacterium]
MTIVATIDIVGLTAAEYRMILDRIDVEAHPASGIYLHLAGAIPGGYRITELWDGREGLDAFLQQTLYPAAQELGIQRELTISVETLHNVFAPRLAELPGLAEEAPGGHPRLHPA